MSSERACFHHTNDTPARVHRKEINYKFDPSVAPSIFTSYQQTSHTFSCLFLRMGVSRGSSSEMGGFILLMPITFTIALRFSVPFRVTSFHSFTAHIIFEQKGGRSVGRIKKDHTFVTDKKGIKKKKKLVALNTCSAVRSTHSVKAG